MFRHNRQRLTGGGRGTKQGRCGRRVQLHVHVRVKATSDAARTLTVVPTRLAVNLDDGLVPVEQLEPELLLGKRLLKAVGRGVRSGRWNRCRTDSEGERRRWR
uniref:(northern house mosquito) hypothetical protein n=1 Tax=Culex pipiens TaxID=7175 RepID=A0A8D8AZ70_CULPI